MNTPTRPFWLSLVRCPHLPLPSVPPSDTERAEMTRQIRSNLPPFDDEAEFHATNDERREEI